VGRRDLAPRVRERLELVKAVGVGPDLPMSARWSGRTEAPGRRWLGRSAVGGGAALADAPRRGRPVVADAADRQAAAAALGTGPRAGGLPVAVWTAARLRADLAATTGVRVAPGWLRAWLSPWGYGCGRPKPPLTQRQDAEAVAACPEEWAAAARKSGAGTGGLRVPSR
jgi:transposase